MRLKKVGAPSRVLGFLAVINNLVTRHPVEKQVFGPLAYQD